MSCVSAKFFKVRTGVSGRGSDAWEKFVSASLDGRAAEFSK